MCDSTEIVTQRYDVDIILRSYCIDHIQPSLYSHDVEEFRGKTWCNTCNKNKGK